MRPLNYNYYYCCCIAVIRIKCVQQLLFMPCCTNNVLFVLCGFGCKYSGISLFPESVITHLALLINWSKNFKWWGKRVQLNHFWHINFTWVRDEWEQEMRNMYYVHAWNQIHQQIISRIFYTHHINIVGCCFACDFCVFKFFVCLWFIWNWKGEKNHLRKNCSEKNEMYVRIAWTQNS